MQKIDRADIRFVVHWDIPGGNEQYDQEIGRAESELLFSAVEDAVTPKRLLFRCPAPTGRASCWLKLLKRR